MLAPASDLDPIIYFIPIWTNVPQIFKLKSNTSWLSDDLLIKHLYTNNNIALGVVGNYVFVFFSDILFLVRVCVCVCVHTHAPYVVCLFIKGIPIILPLTVPP